jgi:putative MFS transporter
VTVNAGARLDRLPISSFHRRVLALIGIGMFFDGFDVYLAATVLGATLKSGFSTIGQNAQFVSVTFLGMMLGSLLTGFLGDRYGRRFTYQANLAVFGFASIASAFAPSMNVLILLRGVMGLGLGAEMVVGFSTLTEFVPPRARGRWLGALSAMVVSSLPISGLIATAIIPRLGWRAMFVLGGLGALVVWYLRKALPESPRWLESVGRDEEANTLLEAIECLATWRASATIEVGYNAEIGRTAELVRSCASASRDRGCSHSHRRQHSDLRVRALAANILCPGGTQHCGIFWFLAGYVHRSSDRIGHRSFYF